MGFKKNIHAKCRINKITNLEKLLNFQ